MEYIALGLKRDQALSFTGLTRHQYYYNPKSGSRGVKPCTEVLRHTGDKVEKYSNEEIKSHMIDIQSNEDLLCGHQRMTNQLQPRGFYINHQKVFRLMKEHQLLLPKKPRPPKTYVKYHILMPSCPLSQLEMDIKFVWVEQHRRHALILSVIDVFTQRILDWHVGMSITQHTVKEVFKGVVINHL